jgi:AmmeMemoRadiSam system protein A
MGDVFCTSLSLKKMKKPTEEFEKQVIQIAALGVWQIVTGRPMAKRLEPVNDPRWQGKNGLFITLRKKGEVRGSMGLLESTTTLPETLFDSAQTAATHDDRFSPITPQEFDDLEIEVTLLTETKKFTKLEDLSIGRAGLVISRGEKRGVLLAHVAKENGWSPEQFLEATCEKAGLSHKAWRDPNTLVEYFESETFDGGNLVKSIQDYI